MRAGSRPRDPDAGAPAAGGRAARAEVQAALEGASPRDCLAARRGSAYEHAEREPRQVCGICGTSAGASLCVPTLVSGEVIGTVLTQRERPLGGSERRAVEDAVAQAAPVVANLRNLAIVEERASTDGLTGVPNARAVQEMLDRMVAQAGRQLSPLTAVVLDLDHFKKINDRYGHQTGDAALTAVGQILKLLPRASDVAGRWGGEEFLILRPDTDARGGFVLAEKIRAAIAALAVPGLPVPITASLGVASLPEHAASGQELVRAADQALYAAKDAGRNQVRTFDEHERGSLDDAARLEAVAATGLVDRAPDEELQRLVRLAAELTGAPTACLSLVEDERQVFVAHHGLSAALEEAGGTPISHSFCAATVHTGQPVIAPDAAAHPLLADNPAIEDHGARAYAGIPVYGRGAQQVGALCAIDDHPREWTPERLSSLERLAATVSTLLTARSHVGA